MEESRYLHHLGIYLLKAAAGNHRTAFPRYQEVLREYVARNQALAANALVLPTADLE